MNKNGFNPRMQKTKPLFAALAAIFVMTCLPAYAEESTGGSLLDSPMLNAPNTIINAKDKNKALAEDEGSILERHYPFYFAYGRPSSKLQVSFKAPIIRDVPLYFGYTQFMFWDLAEKSKPFRDFTYNPELFYRYSLVRTNYLKSIDFGIFGHNSNGKKDADSRSLDKHYVRFNFDREGRRWVTRFGAQLSYLYDFDDTNLDIQRYIGPLSLSVSFIQLFDSWVDKSEVSLSAAPGGKFADNWGRGGYQLAWSFRFGKFSLVPAFYMQYYYGYAETLLNYDQQVSEFRGGIIF